MLRFTCLKKVPKQAQARRRRSARCPWRTFIDHQDPQETGPRGRRAWRPARTLDPTARPDARGFRNRSRRSPDTDCKSPVLGPGPAGSGVSTFYASMHVCMHVLIGMHENFNVATLCRSPQLCRSLGVGPWCAVLQAKELSPCVHCSKVTYLPPPVLGLLLYGRAGKGMPNFG